jgi:DNA mismatch repair protein MutH
MTTPPPRSETELMENARRLAGKTLKLAAQELGLDLPPGQRRAKGWIGELAEVFLGASAGTLSEPDFQLIGVELKTLPVGANGKPRESTYVCTVPLTNTSGLSWETSTVKRKLNRVLWLPVEADPALPMAQRRFGSAILWSPDARQEAALRGDWQELMDMVAMGELDRITSHYGRYLQIRPKAANARALGQAYDEDGNPALTLPRGFYLRTSFTRQIVKQVNSE